MLAGGLSAKGSAITEVGRVAGCPGYLLSVVFCCDAMKDLSGVLDVSF